MKLGILEIGSISMVIGICICRGKEKREELETCKLDSRFRISNNLLALEIEAFFTEVLCLIAFFIGYSIKNQIIN